MPDILEWPDDITTEQLPPMALKDFKAALFTFANNTGLGWDGTHPRALLRLPADILRQWMALMLKCARIGAWPTSTGIVIVVLLPKAEGVSCPSD